MVLSKQVLKICRNEDFIAFLVPSLNLTKNNVSPLFCSVFSTTAEKYWLFGL